MKKVFTIVFTVIVLTMLCPLPGEGGEGAQAKYFKAEACYKKLRNDSDRQKYRHFWINCIEKFKSVYRTDPEGPWAAAGLYMTGTLYSQLYNRSGRTADLQESIDHFERILHRFPQSKYAGRAKKDIAAVKAAKTSPPVATGQAQHQNREGDRKDSGENQFDAAGRCYDKLRANPQRQKYRDAWLQCIDLYDKAYRTDPAGSRAAASLFMNGTLYYDLYKRSFNDSDRQKALERLRRVVTQYPDGAYSSKAQASLREISSHGEPPLAETEADGDPPPAGPSTPGGAAVVTGMRFWSNPNYTRLVIDADHEMEFEFNLLNKDPSNNKPQRLYVDLHNSRLGQGLDKIIPIDDDLLKNARAGQYTAESVRVVVDIKSLVSYDVFSLKEPFRIVMDIKGGQVSETGTSSQAPVANTKLKIDPKASTSDIAKQLSLGVRRIVIDPGHGGKDYGAPGYVKGVHEKHLTLQIAKRLATKLKRELKCEVILTRTSDRYLTLEERTAIANTKDADLFISIHTNASRDKRAFGISTYFLNLADDDESKRVAAMENATSTNNISDLEKILFSLMHYSKINESNRLATNVQLTMTNHLERKGYSQIKSKGVKQAPFYVLLGAQMPSILVETSFISNPRECRRLMSTKYQDRICEGIILGIKKYIKDTNPTAFIEEQPVGNKKG